MQRQTLSLLCLLACLGVLLHGSAAADPCGSLNFFPTAAQITGAAASSPASSVAVTTGVTCSGSQVCNWPSVLNKTAQEAYQTELGTSIAAGGLLRVAVKEYGAKQLRVFFRPTSPLLTQSANAMSCVLAKTPAATRKLTQAATYSVTTPGTWSYSVALNGAGPVATGERTATATGDFSLSTEGAEDDKNYCATISVTLKGYTVSNAPTGFPRQITLPFDVCWYKHNGQATAKFDFGGCSVGGSGYTVNVSRIAPLAQNLTQEGEELLDSEGKPHLLIQPVIQVFGRLNKTIEGVPVEEGASFVNKYFLLTTNLKPTDTLTLSLDDGELEEGYYHLSAKVAVITKFPFLVDLQGPARINQTDIDSIMGFTEYMGFLVRNGTDDEVPLLGLQAGTRVPQISDINVDKEGVAIKGGDALTFSWQFVAAGEERCYHDDVEVSTPCASPMIVAAKAFSANTTKHNFSVVMTDVCGNVKMANFTYTSDGAKAISEIDYVDPNSMEGGNTFSTVPSTATTRRTTGTSAAAPVATAAMLLRNAVAACLASMLLMGLLF